MVYLYLPLAILCWIIAAWFWKRYEPARNDFYAAGSLFFYGVGVHFFSLLTEAKTGLSSDAVFTFLLVAPVAFMAAVIIRTQLRLARKKPSDPTSPG